MLEFLAGVMIGFIAGMAMAALLMAGKERDK